MDTCLCAVQKAMIRHRWWGWVVVLCLLNAGCGLLPRYQKPEVNVLKQWPHAVNLTINDRVDLADMTWWKQFHNDELNTLISTALQRNNQLNIALAKIDYAQSQLNGVKLNWLPGMSLLSGWSQFPVLGNPGAFFIAAPQYILNIFQQYKQQQSASAQVKASMHAKTCVRVVIIAQVSANFFTLLAEQEAYRLYKKLVKLYRQLLALQQTNYNSQLIAEDELDEIQSEIQQLLAQMSIVKHRIAVCKNTLHYLLNDNPGDMVVHSSFQHINSNPFIPSNLPLSVLNNRPDVNEAEALLIAANADIGVSGANLLPSMTLGAYLGSGSSIHGPINLLESYVSIPAVNLPAFAQISASKARYKASYIHYVDTIRGALRDIDNDLSAFRTYSEQLSLNGKALKKQQRHCHLANKRYQYGIDAYIDVLQCNIKTKRLALTLNQNKLEKMLVMVKLYQDLAGGYHGVS